MKSKGADDMKKRPLVLFLLLLLLLSLTPKDVTAEDVDVSSESITSFSETLAHDQMYYPDDEDCLGFGGYFESFKDVSGDWSFHSESTGLPARSFTTDGDVLNFSISYDDTGNEWAKYDIDASGYSGFQYLEIRYKTSATVGNSKSTRLTLSLDGASILNSYSADWNTWKGYVADDISEPYTTLQIMVDDYANTHASGYGYVLIDYIRSGPADELGYSHDCSTVANTTTLRAYDTSDGDHIKFEHLGGGPTGEMAFHTDTGGTALAPIDTGYYPFVGWYAVNLTDAFYCVYADGTLLYNGSGLGLQHTNVKAAGEAEYTIITFVLDTVAESMALDWVKGYSIANFSVAPQASVNTVFYVEDGVLVVDNQGSFSGLYHDPAISVATATYNVWNITSSTGFDLTGDTDVNFKPKVGADQTNLDKTRGTYDPHGTLTDFHFRFYTDALFKISAVKFIDVRNWEEINDVEIVFQIGWSPEIQFGYDAIFIFLGLIMIPASTMYLAWGGRKAMSADKLFYGLVIFALGFGFLIGGIMP